jgi:hypothetical protein
LSENPLPLRSAFFDALHVVRKAVFNMPVLFEFQLLQVDQFGIRLWALRPYDLVLNRDKDMLAVNRNKSAPVPYANWIA